MSHGGGADNSEEGQYKTQARGACVVIIVAELSRPVSRRERQEINAWTRVIIASTDLADTRWLVKLPSTDIVHLYLPPSSSPRIYQKLRIFPPSLRSWWPKKFFFHQNESSNHYLIIFAHAKNQKLV